MTLLFEESQSGPTTHALVIGVGSYRYVDDTSRPRVRALDLRSLTSPPESARLFADWLISEYHNESTPLGSLELLLSSASPRYWSSSRPIDVEVEPATMLNVKGAWDRWFTRCDRDEDNVAIFYFCGHGMKRTHLSLLMEDFGENESRLLENAIDIDASHDGMASTCKARVQCFFADACRQVPYSELGKVTGDGRVLVDEDLATNLAEEAPRFYATLPADPAYGQSGRPTLFTLAVLDALRGTGAGIVRG